MKSTVARLGTVLAILMLTVPVAASAQPAGRVYCIGILGDKASDSSEILLWQTFRAGLREHGWNEGVNIRSSIGGSRAITLGSLKSRLTWSGSSPT